MDINKNKFIKQRVAICNRLAELAQERKLTHQDIADKTGFDRSNVGRMLSGKYSPGLDNLIRLSEVIGYDVAIIKQFININDQDSEIQPKFMFTVDPINNELYILHRQFPSCLIRVIQELPARFIVEDLYDETENPSDILNMPFVEEAKLFWKTYSESLLDLN
jgi:transcriptional regulator with XRE-family HTH domain